jgi:hypothetical protein
LPGLFAFDERVDQHRTLGEFFQDEIATPLGEDIYIRLPEEIPDSRLATRRAQPHAAGRAPRAQSGITHSA